MKKDRFAVVALATLAMALLWVNLAFAGLMPYFAYVPTDWVTDRFAPNSFSDVGAYAGRNNVLGIEINEAQGFTNRPSGYGYTFYNTQGRQHAITGGPGSILSASLYIPASWGDAANGSIRTDMWGVVYDTTPGLSDPHQYPIIGFTNYGGAPRYRVWDEAVGWVDLNTTVAYDAWTTFSIQYTGSSYIFSINGDVVYTNNNANNTTGFTAAIMQAYNFFGDTSLVGANPVNYTAYWSNTPVRIAGMLWLLNCGN